MTRPRERYLDLEISFGPGERVHAELRDLGTAVGSLGFDRAHAGVLLDGVRGEGRPDRAADTAVGRNLAPPPELGLDEPSEELGALLYAGLFAGEVETLLDRGCALIRTDPSYNALRVVLTFENVPELVDLPWELMRADRHQVLLARQVHIVRHLGGRSTRPFTLPGSVRVLLVAASPLGVSPLEIQEELRDIAAAIDDSGRDVVGEPLTSPSLEALRERTRTGPRYDVLHVIGHGALDGGRSVILLEDPHGATDVVDSMTLTNVVYDQPGLGTDARSRQGPSLVVLNSCEGARNAPADHFVSMATTLVANGVPAVVAMQFRILDQAAIQFAGSFYRFLALGFPPERAVAEGRVRIDRHGVDQVACPVLYLGTLAASDSPDTRGVDTLDADIGEFVGRRAERKRLFAAVDAISDPTRSAPVLVGISGMGGVGKSALATHVARLVADRFTHALSVNLRGADTRPVTPLHALGTLLRALTRGVGDLPATVEGRQIMLERLLHEDGGAVLVLDNAHDENQVLPLVPNHPGTVVLVTSRTPLVGVAGLDHVRLEVMNHEDALLLLGTVAPAGLVSTDADREAARVVVTRCGHHPLAIRNAAGRLVLRPDWGMVDLARHLTAPDVLDVLDIRGRLRACFRLTYDDLDSEHARAFRSLGAAPGPDIPAPLLPVLLDRQPREAGRLVDDLIEYQLVEGRAHEQRFTLHDLLREFAAELLALDPVERRESVARAVGWYREQARQHDAALPGARGPAEGRRHAGPDPTRLDRALDPVRPSPPRQRAIEALAWFETERHALVEGIRLAQELSLGQVTWELAQAASRFLWMRGYWTDWETTSTLALRQLRSCERDPGRSGTVSAAIADVLASRGHCYHSLGRPHDGLRDFRLALAYRSEQRDEVGAAEVLAGVASLLQERNPRLSVRCCRAALRVLDDAPARQGGRARAAALVRADVLQVAANVVRAGGELAKAIELAQRSTDIYDRFGDDRGLATVLTLLANVLQGVGRAAESLVVADRALALSRDLGDLYSEAWAIHVRSYAFGQLGQWAEARNAAIQALETRERLPDREPWAESMERNVLALAELGAENFDEAIALARRTLEECRSRDDPGVWSLEILSRALSRRGDVDGAIAVCEERLAIVRSAGDLRLQVTTLAELADLERERGHLEAAAAHQSDLEPLRAMLQERSPLEDGL